MNATPTPSRSEMKRMADLEPGDRIIFNGEPCTVMLPVVRIVTHGSFNAETVVEYDRPSHWMYYDVVAGTDDREFEEARCE